MIRTHALVDKLTEDGRQCSRCGGSGEDLLKACPAASDGEIYAGAPLDLKLALENGDCR